MPSAQDHRFEAFADQFRNFGCGPVNLNHPLPLSRAPRMDKRHTVLLPWNVTFDWDEDKNTRLREERSVGFEEIVIAIAHGGLLDVIEHPGHRTYVVEYNDYCYAVPFVQRPEERIVFLKTIYASRRLTRHYREETRGEGRG